MSIKWQALILIVLILISVTLTKVGSTDRQFLAQNLGVSLGQSNNLSTSTPPNFSYQRASLIATQGSEIQKAPTRNWNVLDPRIKAEAVLIQSLDEQFPFFHYNTYKNWPLASLTKLLTAVVVFEDIGINKKILITERAQKTEGEAGGLKSGEIYTARDLLKIMLLTSSNDAAAAFEDYTGSPEEFLKILSLKAEKIGMSQTFLYDGSGLSDLNRGTANDLLRLIKYILGHEPEIINWTRLNEFLVQPINDVNYRTVYNINPLVKNQNFLGGKTGTSEEAGENLISIFSLENYRVVMILLGSPDRVKESEFLLNWVKEAYTLP